MKNWKNEYQNLGDVRSGRQYRVKFYAREELPNIIDLDSSCRCTKPNYDREKRILDVIYHPGSVPKHLKDQGWYNMEQEIIVTYDDGNKDRLKFSAIVYDKL